MFLSFKFPIWSADMHMLHTWQCFCNGHHLHLISSNHRHLIFERVGQSRHIPDGPLRSIEREHPYKSMQQNTQQLGKTAGSQNAA